MIDRLQVRLARWDSWRKKSVNRSIFAAMLTVGTLTVIVKLVSMVKELVVAHQFGTGSSLDAFLVAFVLPSFAVNVISGSFNAALIPTYITSREQGGREAAQRLFSGAMVWSTISLIIVAALMALFAPYLLPLVGSGFGPEKLALTKSLFYMLLPLLIISGLGTVWRAVLNSGERFALAAAAPVMTAVAIVVALLTLENSWGIYALAAGTVIGASLEAAILAWSLKRQKISLRPRWTSSREPAMRQVLIQSVPMIAGALLMSSTILVDKAMAAMLGSGSVSALNYGNKIVAVSLSVGSLAVGTAVLPHFSRMVAINDWRGVRHTLKTYARLILLATVPASLILVFFSEPLVGLLFQRGAFTAEDTRLVGEIQALYALQVPLTVLGILVVRLIASLRATRILMWGATISFPLNIALNYLFMQWIGVAGIALSTALVQAASFAFLAFSLSRLMRRRERA